MAYDPVKDLMGSSSITQTPWGSLGDPYAQRTSQRQTAGLKLITVGGEGNERKVWARLDPATGQYVEVKNRGTAEGQETLANPLFNLSRSDPYSDPSAGMIVDGKVRVGDLSNLQWRPEDIAEMQKLATYDPKLGYVIPQQAFNEFGRRQGGKTTWDQSGPILGMMAAPFLGMTGLAGAGVAGTAAEGGAVTGAELGPGVMEGGITATGGVSGGAGIGGTTAGGLTAAAGSTALSRIIDGTASTGDWVQVLGTAGSTALGMGASNQQAKTLADIANQNRADRLPYLNKSMEYLNNPEAYGAGPGQAAMKSTLQGLSTRGNPLGSGTSLQLATDAGLRDWRDAVTGFGNMGLSGSDTRANLGMASANATKDMWSNLAGGVSDLVNPKKSIADWMREYKLITG